MHPTTSFLLVIQDKLFNEKTTEMALDLAASYKLRRSDGSDFHGENKPDIQLRTGKENLRIPYNWVNELMGL